MCKGTASQVEFYYVNCQRIGKRCLEVLPCGLGLYRCLCSLTKTLPCQAFSGVIAALRGRNQRPARLYQPWAQVVPDVASSLRLSKSLCCSYGTLGLPCQVLFCGLPFLSLRSWRGRLASALLYLAALVAFSPLPLLLARMFHAYAWPWLGLPLCACKRALNLRS